MSDKNLPEQKGCYIHIPFCVKKCAYCDFYSVEDMSLQSGYVNALIKEIKLRTSLNTKLKPSIDTIYFGGGTPSTLSIKFIEQIISEIYKRYRVNLNTEITMEVNPGTIDRNYLNDLKSLGINRLNIGVQSFDDNNLKLLGRIHSSGQAEKAIESAREEGFKNLGIDLIYGIPNQSINIWLQDLTRVLKYKLQHLSCYMLTFEKNTPLHNDYKKGRVTPVNKEELSSIFLETSNFLKGHGYDHYEISNFSSRAETRSRHNQKYWDFTPYIGLGASAHSFENNTRFWNYSDIKQYINSLENNLLPISEKEALTKEQKIIEVIMLGLRTSKGIELKKLENSFDHVLAQLENEKLGKRKHGHFFLTQKGMCYLDSIIKLFVDYI